MGARSHERNFSGPISGPLWQLPSGISVLLRPLTVTRFSFLTLQISVFTGIILSQFHHCLVETEDNIIYTFSSEVTPKGIPLRTEGGGYMPPKNIVLYSGCEKWTGYGVVFLGKWVCSMEGKTVKKKISEHMGRFWHIKGYMLAKLFNFILNKKPNVSQMPL